MISVCMAVCNGGLYIKEQLASILPQLKSNDEIMLSDDTSTDETLAIIAAFNDPRITVLARNGPRSIQDNFENALRHARGEIIFLSDQDDIWFPDKLALMSRALQDCVLVHCDCTIINDRGETMAPSFFQQRGSGNGFVHTLMKNSYMGCCMAFRRDLLTVCLPFPRDVPMYDWWIGLMGELTGKTCCLEEQLVAYRFHGSNSSDTVRGSGFSLRQKMVWRFRILIQIIGRVLARRGRLTRLDKGSVKVL